MYLGPARVEETLGRLTCLFLTRISGGFIGFILAALFLVSVAACYFPRFISSSWTSVGFVFTFPIFVGFFTVGNGLPGIAACSVLVSRCIGVW